MLIDVFIVGAHPVRDECEAVTPNVVTRQEGSVAVAHRVRSHKGRYGRS